LTNEKSLYLLEAGLMKKFLSSSENMVHTRLVLIRGEKLNSKEY